MKLCKTFKRGLRISAVVTLIFTELAAEGVAAESKGSGTKAKDDVASSFWPAITKTSKPWTYWYWMGNAVDEAGITSHLNEFKRVGLGGVHIIPVYGVEGAENRYVQFLSERWMQLLQHTVQEAERLGLGVDMTCGTGWPFGGPWVQPEHAASRYVIENFEVDKKLGVSNPIRPRQKDLSGAELVVLMAYGPSGEVLEVTGHVDANGDLDWKPTSDGWQLTAMFHTPTNLPVERAAPGGEGLTIDHFSRQSLERYLTKFDAAFESFPNVHVRSIYNDSYENWGQNWTPKLFDEFIRRRGYDLRAHMHELDANNTSNQARRIRSDFRETMAELLYDEFTLPWVKWAHRRGMQVRNEGHGSPGNPLDLYAAADVPETEVFGTGWLEPLGLQPLPGVPAREGGAPEVQIGKFASSAAHFAGRPLCSSETFTWLGDHFKIPLEHMKCQADLMFVMGINHIFIHGSAYSPADAPWPGWLWYAATNVGKYMPAWEHTPALFDYIARCQACLQSGSPDNDVLVYLPIYDTWASDEGARDNLIYTSVHATPVWLEKMMAGFADVGRTLWNRGYTFDCASDRQLSRLIVRDGRLVSPGAEYRALVIPACHLMPAATLEQIARIVDEGGMVLIHKSLPEDVPGFGKLDERRTKFRALSGKLAAMANREIEGGAASAPHLLIAPDLEQLLAAAEVSREPLIDLGLKFIRRRDDQDWLYFIVNHSGHDLEQWVPLSVPVVDAILLDPVTGNSGKSATRMREGEIEVFLQLPARKSVVVRALREVSDSPKWTYHRDQDSHEVTGEWNVEFVAGGPTLPDSRKVSELADWTTWPSDSSDLTAFSGTARYSIDFDCPSTKADGWKLDLGRVDHSALVRLNDQVLGTLVASPYQLDATRAIHPGKNRLQIEIINLPANRVADLDRRGANWKNFFFVDIRYRPFDAKDWPPVSSGLLGPVRLIRQQTINPIDSSDG